MVTVVWNGMINNKRNVTETCLFMTTLVGSKNIAFPGRRPPDCPPCADFLRDVLDNNTVFVALYIWPYARIWQTEKNFKKNFLLSGGQM